MERVSENVNAEVVSGPLPATAIWNPTCLSERGLPTSGSLLSVCSPHLCPRTRSPTKISSSNVTVQMDDSRNLNAIATVPLSGLSHASDSAEYSKACGSSNAVTTQTVNTVNSQSVCISPALRADSIIPSPLRVGRYVLRASPRCSRHPSPLALHSCAMDAHKASTSSSHTTISSEGGMKLPVVNAHAPARCGESRGSICSIHPRGTRLGAGNARLNAPTVNMPPGSSNRCHTTLQRITLHHCSSERDRSNLEGSATIQNFNALSMFSCSHPPDSKQASLSGTHSIPASYATPDRCGDPSMSFSRLEHGKMASSRPQMPLSRCVASGMDVAAELTDSRAWTSSHSVSMADGQVHEPLVSFMDQVPDVGVPHGASPTESAASPRIPSHSTYLIHTACCTRRSASESSYSKRHVGSPYREWLRRSLRKSYDSKCNVCSGDGVVLSRGSTGSTLYTDVSLGIIPTHIPHSLHALASHSLPAHLGALCEPSVTLGTRVLDAASDGPNRSAARGFAEPAVPASLSFPTCASLAFPQIPEAPLDALYDSDATLSVADSVRNNVAKILHGDREPTPISGDLSSHCSCAARHGVREGPFLPSATPIVTEEVTLPHSGNRDTLPHLSADTDTEHLVAKPFFLYSAMDADCPPEVVQRLRCCNHS